MREISAVVIAIPALGPSLGTAPSMKWTWIFFSVKALTSSSERSLATLILAIETDSLITYLRLPLKLNYPFAYGYEVSKHVSIVITYPTNPATVRILAVPGLNTILFLSSRSASNTGLPRYLFRSSILFSVKSRGWILYLSIASWSRIFSNS